MITVKVLNFETNSQITGRVTPSMVDLVVALAAGAVGAFAMSRDDVAEPSPGVIALQVPPLCVVGISLGNAEWGDAWGAFLLFLTNFLSILLAGGAVFAIMGLQKASTEKMSGVNRGRAYRIIAIGVVLVAIPLAFTTFKVGRDSYAQVQVGSIANEWVQQFDGDFIVESVLVSGSVSQILVTGPELPETITDLGEEVEANVKQIKEVHVKFVPSKEFEYVTTNAD